MTEIGRIINPQKITSSIVQCQVQIKLGDGIGSDWEWVEYVAGHGDTVSTGNQIWARLCSGDFGVDEGFTLNFSPSDLTPDSNQASEY